MSNEGFHFGAKLVRGAYKEQERQRSAELGYKDPIHDSFEDTCTSFNKVTEIILDKVACSPAEVMLATHNEESVQLATKRYRSSIIMMIFTVMVSSKPSAIIAQFS